MDSAPTTALRSILEKPLNQLTEEDISQLTREDCRKYLKDKGMRRPSWNKSQAIQQVISLKALLEGSDNSSAATLRKVLVLPQPEIARPRLNASSNSVDSVKEMNCSVGISFSADETVPNWRKDVPRFNASEELNLLPAAKADKKGISLRTPSTTNGSAGQMTIFYCGKVNVYDEIPEDKAQEIMHLAANPIHFHQNDQVSGTATVWYVPYQSQTANDRIPADVAISPTMQTEKIIEYPQHYKEKGIMTRPPDLEGQANRKVLLQRYFEKRKDRVKFKNKKDVGLNPSSMEMFMSHRLEIPSSNGQLHRSSTSSPTQAGHEPNLCSTPDNQGKVFNLSADNNDKDVQGRRI